MSQVAISIDIDEDVLTFFARKLLGEVESCFNQEAASAFIHLIAVGGLQIQDAPMSGQLEETSYLDNNQYLCLFLRCFKLPLARVYLVDQKTPTVQPATIYQSPTHSLFYQSIYFSLESGNLELLSLSQLSSSLGSESRYYLVIEMACDSDLSDKKESYFNDEGLNTKNKDSLNIITAGLDILSGSQTALYLSTIGLHCEPKMDVLVREKFNIMSRKFLTHWQALYQKHGRNYSGEYSYQCELNYFSNVLMPFISPILNTLTKENQLLVKTAIDMISLQLSFWPATPQRINRKELARLKQRKSLSLKSNHISAKFDRPIFIVSAPRSGSTLLFETLVQFNNLWSTGEENHALLENIQGLHPKENNFNSNRLTEKNVGDFTLASIRKAFSRKLQDREQNFYLMLESKAADNSLRFLEKTPKNALRIPFIKALFPDALFIYLHRDAKSNISSLIDGWRSQRFISYQNLPGEHYRHWRFLLIPGWQKMSDYRIADIAEQQWKQSNQIIQDDLKNIAEKDWMALDYDQLIDQPEQAIKAVSEFADLEWDTVIEARCQQKLPVSRLTLTSPCVDKWLKHKMYFNTGKSECQ